MIYSINFGDFINLGSLFSFLFGIFFGLSIAFLMYIYSVLKTLKKNKYLVNVQNYDIDAKEIELLVKSYQEGFQEEKLKGIGDNIVRTTNISKEMSIKIAEKFFPDSKYPLYEISIDEAIMLATYITKRVDELLSHRGLRLFRKIKISQIIKWSTVKKEIDETAIVQTSKKYKIKQKIKAVMGVLNIVNPVYWVKRVVVDKSTNIVIRKICTMVIGIVGEETYKVYSKSLFKEEMEIDTGVENYFKELKEELDKDGTIEVGEVA